MGNVHMEATQINYRGGSKKMSVEEAIKKAGSEITPEEKTWIDSIPALTTSNAGKTDQTVIAPEFDSEAGVYAIGDLVMYEGKLYEFTTAHETPGEWDSTEVTEKTVSDEIDSLKSGLTSYELQNNVNLEVPKRKNLLPLDLATIKSLNTSGTWSGDAYTLNGVTFDVQTDTNGNVTGIKATGTASARADFVLMGYIVFSTNSYILNGCPSDGSANTFLLIAGTTTDRLATDTGSSSGFSISQATSISSTIRIMSGYAIQSDGLTFYPMIRLATITDTTFATYTPSVESRLAALEAAVFNS